MTPCRNLLAVTLFSLAIGPAVAQPSGEDRLVELMGAEQFRAAGLHKLSAEEQGALLRWLEKTPAAELSDTAAATATGAASAVVPPNSAETTAAAAPALDTGYASTAPAADEDDGDIESRILPPFSGWTGKTEFRLENGQVWRQRQAEVHRFDGNDTRVRIKRNFLGFYWMELLADGEKVAVKRVK